MCIRLLSTFQCHLTNTNILDSWFFFHSRPSVKKTPLHNTTQNVHITHKCFNNSLASPLSLRRNIFNEQSFAVTRKKRARQQVTLIFTIFSQSFTYDRLQECRKNFRFIEVYTSLLSHSKAVYMCKESTRDSRGWGWEEGGRVGGVKDNVNILSTKLEPINNGGKNLRS